MLHEFVSPDGRETTIEHDQFLNKKAGNLVNLCSDNSLG